MAKSTTKKKTKGNNNYEIYMHSEHLGLTDIKDSKSLYIFAQCGRTINPLLGTALATIHRLIQAVTGLKSQGKGQRLTSLGKGPGHRHPLKA